MYCFRALASAACATLLMENVILHTLVLRPSWESCLARNTPGSLRTPHQAWKQL